MGSSLPDDWSCAARPRGGSTSPLEKYANFLLTLIEGQPDLTLDEVVCAMRKRKVSGSRTAVWRFFQRHKMTLKKSLSAAAQRADVARARRRWMREQGMFDAARLVFIDGHPPFSCCCGINERALTSSYENERPSAAPIWATSRDGARLSSRASSDACSEVGIASGALGPAATKWSPASATMPLSTTVLVSSSINSGTPSVRSAICSEISLGSALPPVTWRMISAPYRRGSRLRVSIVTWGRPIQGGVNSGRKVKNHEHTHRWQPIDQEIEGLASGGITPVHVFPHHQHRLTCGQTLKLRQLGVKCLLLALLRGEFNRRIPVARWDRQQICQ